MLQLPWHHLSSMATGRDRLNDAQETLNIMILDDAENDFDEPMCAGSDEEFPDPDFGDDRYTHKIPKIML